MPSVSFWYTIFGPSLYEKVVDKSLQLLFGWTELIFRNHKRKWLSSHVFKFISEIIITLVSNNKGRAISNV